MLNYTIISLLHILSIIGLSIILYAEWVLLSFMLSQEVVKKLKFLDKWYGIVAVFVLLTGTVKIYLGKGFSYYMHNWIFLSKIAIFFAIGFISIYPTIKIIKWSKSFNEPAMLHIDDAKSQLVKKMVILECILLLSLPILAVAVANGYGQIY